MEIIELIDYIEEFFPGTFDTEDKRRRWEISFGDTLTPGPDLRTAIDAWLESVGPSRKRAPKAKDIKKFWPAAPGEATKDGKTRLDREAEADAWGKAMVRGAHGHQAATAKPTFMNELFIWAKRHPDRFPSIDQMDRLASQGAQFHDNFHRLVDERELPDGSGLMDTPKAPRGTKNLAEEFRLVLVKSLAGMMGREGAAIRYHEANCDICNQGLALLPEL